MSVCELKTEEEVLKELERDPANWKLNSENWLYVVFNIPLSDDFIIKYRDFLYGWNYITKYQKPSEKLIRQFAHEVNFSKLSDNRKFSDEFLIDFKDRINWYTQIKFGLSENVLRTCHQYISHAGWIYIMMKYDLSEKFVYEFDYKIDKFCIFENKKVCKKLPIEYFINNVEAIGEVEDFRNQFSEEDFNVLKQLYELKK